MTVNKKPIIAVQPLVDEKKDSLWMLPGYFDGIREAGGIPVMLPLISDKKDIKRFAEEFDGFLFTGGHDVNPELYGTKDETGTVQPCIARDEMETLLLKEVMKLDKPIFGICRGLQFINAALGGTLYQDLPIQKPSDITHRQKPPYDKPSHQVTISDDGWLHDLLKSNSIMVNSCHHQGIKDLADDLKSCATSDDGLIEAIEMPGKKYLKAVQWHPEFLYKNDKASKAIFKSFVDACKKSAKV